MLLHGSYDFILTTTLGVNMVKSPFYRSRNGDSEKVREVGQDHTAIECATALLSALESEATIENKGVIPLCNTNLGFGKLAYS